MAKFDVLVVGDGFVDLIFTGLPRFPELGKEVFGTGLTMIPGGAYNAALTMHRLGLKVAWATDLGSDDFSRFILERARAEGLDESLFVHHRRPYRRVTVAASFPEDRAFITYCDPEPAVSAAMKALATVSARVLYIPGLYTGPLLDVGLKLVRARRMRLVMDGNNSDPITLADPAVRRAVQAVDVFSPNADEARRMTGQSDLSRALEALAALCPLVVIKDGAGGAVARSGGQTVHAPALPVTPLETTGAGDCFDAGFLCAWLEGRSLEECLRWGNVVGGLSTLEPGGTGRAVTRDEVERMLGGTR